VELTWIVMNPSYLVASRSHIDSWNHPILLRRISTMTPGTEGLPCNPIQESFLLPFSLFPCAFSALLCCGSAVVDWVFAQYIAILIIDSGILFRHQRCV